MSEEKKPTEQECIEAKCLECARGTLFDIFSAGILVCKKTDCALFQFTPYTKENRKGIVGMDEEGLI